MISIIIPAYNEASFIGETISTIKQFSKENKGIEIVVVNNGSNDKTSTIVSVFQDVTLIDLTCKVSISEARNIGVSKSNGDVLAFIDADILITELWMESLLEFEVSCQDNPLVITGCKVSISKNPTWIEKNWFKFLKGSTVYINSGNLICSRRVFDIVNGFSSVLKTGEDVDFCLRSKKNGINVIQDEAFQVFHEGYPKTIKDFFDRERWHGIGDLQSYELFFSSKVALIALVFVFMSLASLWFILSGEFLLAGAVFVLLLFLNAITLFKRVSIKTMSQLVLAFFINYIYFLARFCSCFSRNIIRAR